MAESDELRLLERLFSIPRNSCLVIIPMYDVFLSQEHTGYGILIDSINEEKST